MTLWTVAHLCSRDSPDKNTGVGCHASSQRIFLTYELNLSLQCLLQVLQTTDILVFKLLHLFEFIRLRNLAMDSSPEKSALTSKSYALGTYLVIQWFNTSP